MAERPGPTTAIRVWAARGGHGATTVSVAMGVHLGLTVVGHDPDALFWMWPGQQTVRRVAQPHVADAGVFSTDTDHSRANVVVLRGPCALGVKSIAQRADLIDHLIVIREPWRSIRREDVEAALSTTIAAEIIHSPRVARLADAGLLSERVDGLEEFAELKTWALAQWSAPAQDPPEPGLHS